MSIVIIILITYTYTYYIYIYIYTYLHLSTYLLFLDKCNHARSTAKNPQAEKFGGFPLSGGNSPEFPDSYFVNRVQCRHIPNKQTNKQPSKQTHKQASERASKQGSKEASKQASERANKQANDIKHNEAATHGNNTRNKTLCEQCTAIYSQLYYSWGRQAGFVGGGR